MPTSNLLVNMFALLAVSRVGQAQDVAVAFEGVPTSWHGFDRYDFLLDEATLAIKPADPAVKGDVPGQRRCIVVAPRTPAPGRPWSWRGCYWDHQPQTEIELLRRGFHIAYINANATLAPDKKWDAWYEFLTTRHGLSPKPTFIGMSRGGMFAFRWATGHPQQVSAIYADNPAVERESLARLGDLASADVPLMMVCGSLDPLLGGNALAVENIYQQFGGRVSVMIKDGAGHHPHSLHDPGLLADFLEQSIRATPPAPPDFVTAGFTRTTFYGVATDHRDFPREGTRISCRGPAFTDCYQRYNFGLEGVEGTINVIAPNTAALGRPWVFRVGWAQRDAVVDLALLASGFQIVTGPISYNADGPIWRHWEATYQHLVSHGFAVKTVMEGAGRGAGEVCAWAIEHPDKVACLYVENPVLRSLTAKTPPLDNLAPLAHAGVPLVLSCGSLDAEFNTQARVVEQRYQALGGPLTLVVREGDGYGPPAPRDVQPVVAAIAQAASRR
jgi:pimeloyl-ACP methyl ester carboxylesterase